VEWILKLAAAGGEGPCVDIMEISKPDHLGDIANLGLTLTEAKQLLARVQREISTAQAREHAVRRPVCPCRDGVCRVKDYRDHAVATLFGQVTMRLPRFRCAACGRIETGINWPSHCRSTPELDRLRAHLSALMTYRVSADLLEHMFPVDVGIDPRTLRRHTLKAGAALADRAAIRPHTYCDKVTDNFLSSRPRIFGFWRERDIELDGPDDISVQILDVHIDAVVLEAKLARFLTCPERSIRKPCFDLALACQDVATKKVPPRREHPGARYGGVEVVESATGCWRADMGDTAALDPVFADDLRVDAAGELIVPCANQLIARSQDSVFKACS
jgi:hypothetical protein